MTADDAGHGAAGGTRRRRGRGSARAAMHARRALPPSFNPAAPGQRGGRYRPLSDVDCERICAEALRVLDEIGMGEVPKVLSDKAREAGAVLRGDGRLSFPKAFVEDIVAGACKSFTFHGRDERHDIEVGGDRVHFGTGGAAVQTLDLDTHRYRAATLADLHDFTALCDALTNVGWFKNCCIATDIEDVLELDLNTAYALLRGGGEEVLLNAAAAQLGNRFGLPTGAACSMSDAKAVDAQMGAEKALTALAAGLAGANMLYESSGMMASLLGASFEAFVVDDEMLSHVNRVLRGVEVDDESLGFEAIRAAVFGDGHFLGGAHTLAAMERDYFYPTLADRDPPTLWEAGGAHDMWTRANVRARELLARERPVHLDPGVDRVVRERFRVRSV